MKKEIRTMNKEGTIVQVTIADERWYLVENDEGEVTAYPSVTWITDFYPKGIGFYKWLAAKGWDEAESIKSSAGDKGTKVHHIATDLLHGKKIEIDGNVINDDGEEEEIGLEEYEGAMSFVDWFKIVEPEIIANEIAVFNEEHFYAGTADFVFKLKEDVKWNRTTMKKGTWLLDFKTGQHIWPNYGLQVSAYKHALPMKIDHMGILQLGYKLNKDGFKLTVIDDQFALFLATKQIWQEEAGKTQVFKADYPVELSLGIPASKALKA